jgi:amino acid permease
MNWKQVAAIGIGMLLLLAIFMWPGAWSVGEVVSRVPAGPDAEFVTASISYTPAARILTALVALVTVIAVIRLRHRAAS